MLYISIDIIGEMCNKYEIYVLYYFRKCVLLIYKENGFL